MQEEIFGPVVCLSPFDSEEEVIERVNNVAYIYFFKSKFLIKNLDSRSHK